MKYSYHRGIRGVIESIRFSLESKEDDYMVATPQGLVTQDTAREMTKRGLIRWDK